MPLNEYKYLKKTDKGQHIDLATGKPKSDNRAFNAMEAVSRKDDVDIIRKVKESNTRGIHTALLAFGMTPAYGNIADVADAALYALEGEFGEAAWSMAAAIPIVGQMVSGRRAAKVAKEAGEEMVTLYRGVGKWFPGKMVKKGNFIGGGGFAELQGRNVNTLWTSTSKEYASQAKYVGLGKGIITLEFEVPKSYIKKFGKAGWEGMHTVFEKGLPKEFLKKVHKVN
jgi:hypothetical protein